MFLIKIYTCNKSEAWPRWCYGYCTLSHTVQRKSQRNYCGSRLKWRSKGKYKNNSTADGWKKHINLQFSFAATILQLKLSCIEFKIKQVTWSGNLCAQYIINTYFCNQGWLKEQKSNNIFRLTSVNMCPIEYYLTVCSTFFVHSYAWLSKIEKIQKILEIELLYHVLFQFLMQDISFSGTWFKQFCTCPETGQRKWLETCLAHCRGKFKWVFWISNEVLFFVFQVSHLQCGLQHFYCLVTKTHAIFSTNQIQN